MLDADESLSLISIAYKKYLKAKKNHHNKCTCSFVLQYKERCQCKVEKDYIIAKEHLFETIDNVLFQKRE